MLLAVWQAVIAIALFMAPALTRAELIEWHLVGVIAEDGARFQGYFIIDTEALAITEFLIESSGGAAPFPARFIYDSTTTGSSAAFLGGGVPSVRLFGTDQQLRLAPSLSLDTSTPFNPLITVFEGTITPSRELPSGMVVTPRKIIAGALVRDVSPLRVFSLDSGVLSDGGRVGGAILVDPLTEQVTDFALGTAGGSNGNLNVQTSYVAGNSSYRRFLHPSRSFDIFEFRRNGSDRVLRLMPVQRFGSATQPVGLVTDDFGSAECLENCAVPAGRRTITNSVATRLVPQRQIGVVTQLGATGPGSLDAVLDQVSTGFGNEVRFAPGLAGTIVRNRAIELRPGITIRGPGANVLELRRNSGSEPILTVASNVVARVIGLGIAGANNSAVNNSGYFTGIGLNIRDNAGRGIFNGQLAQLRLRNSTISGNNAGDGSAVLNEGGFMVLANTTITGNSVTIPVLGGGTVLNRAPGFARLTNVTLSGNAAQPQTNGGVVNQSEMVMHNTVIAGNGGGAALIGTLRSDSSHNLFDIDPQLGPLQLNGGGTPTLLPVPTTPLRNAGNNALIVPSIFGSTYREDQRGAGFPRTVGGIIDIGAVEIGCLLGEIAPGALPAGTIGESYAAQQLSVGGGTPPYTFTITSGVLPDGLTLNVNSVISGTPTAAGQYAFQIGATDRLGCTNTREFQIQIDASEIVLSDGFEGG
jgi:hypothetical protein